MSKGKAPTVEAIVRGPKLFRLGVLRMSEFLVGDPVGLFREPDNPKDSNAIQVLDMAEQPFGYIAREKAAILAPWMDRGWFYTAKVIQVPKVRHLNGRIGIERDGLIVRCTPIEPAKKAYSQRVTFLTFFRCSSPSMCGA